MRAFLTLALLLQVACVPLKDLDEAPCPCLEALGYACDTSTGVCRRTTQTVADAGPVDAGLSDSGPRLPVVCGLETAPNLLVNPGFETRVTSLGLPAEVGFWAGDMHEVVEGEGGIVPAEGEVMLAFRATGTDRGGIAQAAQMHQIVYVYDRFGAGTGARLLACASFNRVEGTETSDSQFTIYVRGYLGHETTFQLQYITEEQAYGPVRSDVFTDAVPATWERICVDELIDAPFDLLGIEVRVRENISAEDITGEEFDGHFVDDVCLALVP